MIRMQQRAPSADNGADEPRHNSVPHAQHPTSISPFERQRGASHNSTCELMIAQGKPDKNTRTITSPNHFTTHLLPAQSPLRPAGPTGTYPHYHIPPHTSASSGQPFHSRTGSRPHLPHCPVPTAGTPPGNPTAIGRPTTGYTSLLSSYQLPLNQRFARRMRTLSATSEASANAASSHFQQGAALLPHYQRASSTTIATVTRTQGCGNPRDKNSALSRYSCGATIQGWLARPSGVRQEDRVLSDTSSPLHLPRRPHVTHGRPHSAGDIAVLTSPDQPPQGHGGQPNRLSRPHHAAHPTCSPPPQHTSPTPPRSTGGQRGTPAHDGIEREQPLTHETGAW